MSKQAFVEYYQAYAELLPLLEIPVPKVQVAGFYELNASSLLPVKALAPQPGEIILDACAAPGGKALLIAEAMQDKGNLTVNDTSPARSQRLRNTLEQSGHTNITYWRAPAETIFKKHPEQFDAILLDAPCSSEKHVWNDPAELAKWSPARIKQLYYRQFALINGLWLALKPGGRLVYVTCALNEKENEGVVADFQKRHPEAVLAEQQRILPDGKTYDPMFWARFNKPL